MKAIGYKIPLPISEPGALEDIELPRPSTSDSTATGHDLLISVKAIAVNPVDYKVRRSAKPAENEYRVLGFDASGIVEEVGPHVTLFQPGDEVYYSGTLNRPGSNAEFQLVDERIVGHKPKSLSFAESAAIPLTAVTAWELLFDRIGVPRIETSHGTRPKTGLTEDSILILGGAGGVGSMLTQLARRLTALKIIATASRPETKQWCIDMGAHHVIDHTKPLPEQLAAIGIPEVQIIAALTGSDEHYPAMIDVLAPQGAIGIIDDPKTLDAKPLKRKSISLHWELMFTRSVFNTPDMIEQHRILSEVARLIDTGQIKTTLGEHLGIINATNLKRAHALLESGRAKGKIVLEGF